MTLENVEPKGRGRVFPQVTQGTTRDLNLTFSSSLLTCLSSPFWNLDGLCLGYAVITVEQLSMLSARGKISPPSWYRYVFGICSSVDYLIASSL